MAEEYGKITLAEQPGQSVDDIWFREFASERPFVVDEDDEMDDPAADEAESLIWMKDWEVVCGRLLRNGATDVDIREFADLIVGQNSGDGERQKKKKKKEKKEREEEGDQTAHIVRLGSILAKIVGSERLGKRDFSSLWRGFGDLEHMAAAVLEVVEQKWFCFHVSDDDAERYLAGAFHGMFLVKFVARKTFHNFKVFYSKNDVDPAADVRNSAPDNEGVVQNLSIYGCYPEHGFNLSGGDVDTRFASLRDAVAALEATVGCTHPVFHPYMDELWFHGSLTMEDAGELLEGVTPPAFVVRFSSKKDTYSVSKITAKSGGVVHVRLACSKTGSVYDPKSRKSWASIHSFLRHGSFSCPVPSELASARILCKTNKPFIRHKDARPLPPI